MLIRPLEQEFLGYILETARCQHESLGFMMALQRFIRPFSEVSKRPVLKNYKISLAQNERHRSLASFPEIAANGLNDALDRTHVNAVNNALRGPGIALVNLAFSDPNSNYLEHLLQSLGRYHKHGPAITHSATCGAFWDVRPKEKVFNSKHQARSEGTGLFPWHTDCSYESQPPQYFALHVLHADQCGGGTLSILNATQLVEELEPHNRETLFRPEFSIIVPPEFDKGITSIVGSLLTRPSHQDPVRIRFRADIVQPLTPAADEALQAVRGLLERSSRTEGDHLRTNLTSQQLPAGSVILIDNGRWLHSRSEVKDNRRHLRRVRWDRQSFSDLVE